MEITLSILAFFLGITLVIVVIPPIIRVGHAKHLFDTVNERKLHTKTIPPLGGVAIFIGFNLATVVATGGIRFDELKYIQSALIVLLFIGLKDDMMDISARMKLMVEIFAAFLMVGMGDIRFTNLHGVLGIYDIGLIPSMIISVFAIIVIINAFNLIDGIDGLASGLAIVSTFILGLWFFFAGNYTFAIMAFALIGSLVGFFIFNVFGEEHKLFMGDTGSLIIGLIIATLIIKFNEMNINFTSEYAIQASPAVSFAIIIIPLIDTLRVMTIRIINKKSPFSADNNHIHHRLYYFFKKHIIITSILIASNIALFFFALYLNKTGLNVNYQLLLLIVTSVVISFVPSIFIRLNEDRKNQVVLKSRWSQITRLFFW